MIKSTQGKRYNKGKLRYSLLPSKAIEKVVEVYTKGRTNTPCMKMKRVILYRERISLLKIYRILI
jgi:hypothetical protein